VSLTRGFIQHGADLLAKDNDGLTPFDIAFENDNDPFDPTSDLDAVQDYILTVAYKDQVFEEQGNRSIHAILEAAEYRYLVEEEEPEEEQENEEESVQQQQQTLQICLPVGKLTVDKFRLLLRSFDGDLMRHEDDTGAIPFHVACRTAAPPQILGILLEEFPGALHVTDDNNSLPIHFACQADAPSLSVLQFLLERDPAAVRALDNTGALPLHRLCRAKPPDDTVTLLLAAYEGSISVRTNNGVLPFTVACQTRASLSVMLILLRAYPDALEDM